MYQSIGIYEDDPPIPPMMANGGELTADRMYLFEIIAIENGRYMRLLKLDCDNLRYKMKMDAMKRQGKRTDLTFNPLGGKLKGIETAEIVGEEAGEGTTQADQGVSLIAHALNCYLFENYCNLLSQFA